MKKDWTDKLRDKLQAYEEQPPQGLWDDIEKNLHTTLTVQKVRPIIPKWGKTLIATAATLLIGIHLIQFLSEKPKIIIEPNSELLSKLGSMEINMNIPEELKNAFTYELAMPHMKQEIQTSSGTLTTKPENIVHPKITEEDASTTSINHPTPTDIGDDSNIEKETGKETGVNPLETPIEEVRNKQIITRSPRKIISVSLFAGNMSGQRGTTKGYGRNIVQLAAATLPEGDISIEPPIEHEMRFYNQYSETKEETVNNLPISFGITASYPLTNRLFIESGLTYTYLSSKTREGTEIYFSEKVRKQHLLGLPVLLKYHLWSYNNLDLYISGGGAIQWGILSISQTSYYIDKDLTSRRNNPNDPRYIIGSVKGAVGIRYKILPNVGIFAEPGINYHFKRDDMPKSIYTDAPLNFNLNMGLNFQF